MTKKMEALFHNLRDPTMDICRITPGPMRSSPMKMRTEIGRAHV